VTPTILDGFAGAGGWDVAAARLGWRPDGVEILDVVRATRDAAGLTTVGKDVREIVTVPGEYDMHVMSPPCVAFTSRGAMHGRRAYRLLLKRIDVYRQGGTVPYAELARVCRSESTALILEPLRLALSGRPTFVVWEQVPEVLRLWEACAVALREHGYSVVTGKLYAEAYGTPQSRTRALLLARRDGVDARFPEPVYARYRVPRPVLPPAISAASALGWPDGTRMVSHFSTGSDGARRGFRTSDQPAATMTSRADCIKVHFPGGEVRNLLVEEAAVLQGFPADYPFQGNKKQRVQQIGNAIPVQLAEAVLAMFAG
jgi:DNA (cytosine-5)-methyltransferase 1